MRYSQANEIASRWYEAAGELGVSTDNYGFLRKSLGVLLSDDAEAGIGFQASVPVIIAFDGDRLVCLVIKQPSGDEEPTVSAASISAANSPRLDVEVTVSRASRTGFLVKTWTLWEANTKALKITTRSSVNGDFETDYGGDAVMTSVAARLDWPIPS